MYTIQELRALHKLSKPELKKALENANNVLKSEVMSPKTKLTLAAFIAACESYDDTIDTLFTEIDRLNSKS